MNKFLVCNQEELVSLDFKTEFIAECFKSDIKDKDHDEVDPLQVDISNRVDNILDDKSHVQGQDLIYITDQ